MSGMAARCRVSRLSECLLVISEQAAGLLLVKRTPSIAEGQRTSGISESKSMIIRRYYCYRPIPEVRRHRLNVSNRSESGHSASVIWWAG